MAHWPDSMVTYLPEDAVLFSSDIFGQLIATSERFDFEIPPPFDDAALYYANIILPFNHIVLKTLNALKKMNLKLDYVLPDHGVIWKDHINDIISLYGKWASGECAEGVLVLYDSMWGSTEIMANRIYHTLTKKGVPVRKLHIRSNPMSKIVTEIMMSKVVLIGTPTMNDTIFPTVGHLLIYLQGLRPGPGRLWGTFGSYGWGGGGVDFITRWFKENQYQMILPPLESQFRPQKEILIKCDAFAEDVAKNIQS
jgi:flavorubredoxin